MRDSTRQFAYSVHFLRLEELSFQGSSFGDVFGKHFKIIQCACRPLDRATRKTNHNSLTVFSFPLGFHLPEVPVPPVIVNQLFPKLRFHIDIGLDIALQKLCFGLISEHANKSRIHLQESAVQSHAINTIRSVLHHRYETSLDRKSTRLNSSHVS